MLGPDGSISTAEVVCRAVLVTPPADSVGMLRMDGEVRHRLKSFGGRGPRFGQTGGASNLRLQDPERRGNDTSHGPRPIRIADKLRYSCRVPNGSRNRGLVRKR